MSKEIINSLEIQMKEFQTSNAKLLSGEKPYPVLEDINWLSALDECAGGCTTDENDDRSLQEKNPDIVYVKDEQNEIYICGECIAIYLTSNISYLHTKINFLKEDE